ncbi:heme ABC transporter, partial [Klebsiella pneumoniae]
ERWALVRRISAARTLVAPQELAGPGAMTAWWARRCLSFIAARFFK